MSENQKNDPIAGNLLISEPFLQDENFIRSVVLLCDHNEEGSFGLVLNKPSILHLGDLVEELAFLDNEVFVGGPVEQNTLHFIYFGEKALEGSIPIGNGIWWGGDFESLVENLKLGRFEPQDIMFFIGYSGWGAGQLTEELEANTWIVYRDQISPETLQNTPEELWKGLLKNMGGEFKVIANYPVDPRLN
ncbi:YqgE/AlgH family protein [Algoriphagus taiwanensis]|uniref:YqgE/AlgH family protein n=1 Tax=Algoriphagus taiwanensis TaxID=1445656 RepID=A0ABQ6PZB5_9BACT|nr:YqgE/AlgH family protein [Algoriphagus taiwanensis]